MYIIVADYNFVHVIFMVLFWIHIKQRTKKTNCGCFVLFKLFISGTLLASSAVTDTNWSKWPTIKGFTKQCLQTSLAENKIMSLHCFHIHSQRLIHNESSQCFRACEIQQQLQLCILYSVLHYMTRQLKRVDWTSVYNYLSLHYIQNTNNN